MDLVEHFRGMLAYETWANGASAASLESVPDQGRLHPSYDRAVRLIPHNLLARKVWLGRLRGEVPELPVEWFPRMTTGAMRDLAATVDRSWTDFLSALRVEDLSRECGYVSSEGVRYVSTVGEVLTHVFNHSTYHRGQVARLVAECGGQRAVTDHIVMTRRRANP